MYNYSSIMIHIILPLSWIDGLGIPVLYTGIYYVCAFIKVIPVMSLYSRMSNNDPTLKLECLMLYLWLSYYLSLYHYIVILFCKNKIIYFNQLVKIWIEFVLTEISLFYKQKPARDSNGIRTWCFRMVWSMLLKLMYTHKYIEAYRL